MACLQNVWYSTPKESTLQVACLISPHPPRLGSPCSLSPSLGTVHKIYFCHMHSMVGLSSILNLVSLLSNSRVGIFLPFNHIRCAQEKTTDGKCIVCPVLHNSPCVLVAPSSCREEWRIAEDVAEDLEIYVFEAPFCQICIHHSSAPYPSHLTIYRGLEGNSHLFFSSKLCTCSYRGSIKCT